MNWQSFWDQQAIVHENPHAQVARVSQGSQAGQKELENIAFYIKEILDIQKEDHVLDLCCGNGMLSRELAKHCSQLTGIDFSEPLIEIAQDNFQAKNITYLQGDVIHLDKLDIGLFDNINLYFSFQYFDTYPLGQQVIQQMANKLKPGGKILIGDVPDADKLKVFYPSRIQRFRYRLARITGRDQMGRFWKEAEMKRMAVQANLHLKKLEQPDGFLYQHYRVDYLLKKGGKVVW